MLVSLCWVILIDSRLVCSDPGDNVGGRSRTGGHALEFIWHVNCVLTNVLKRNVWKCIKGSFELFLKGGNEL